MMRSSWDYSCAIGVEASWNRVPPRLSPLRLLAEDLRVTGHYEGRRELADSRIATPRKLVRTHAEGGISLIADSAALHRIMPLVTGESWVAASSGGGQLLTAQGRGDVPSVTFARRLSARDDWQIFSGLLVQALHLFPAADGGLNARLACLGAGQVSRPRLTVTGTASAAAGLRLAAPPAGIRLRPSGGRDVGALFLAGFEIAFNREGARPHFALGSGMPQMITPGQLSVQVGIRLLANDAAKNAGTQDQLAVDIRLEEDGGHVDLSFGRMSVVARREAADAGGGPALVQLVMRGEVAGNVLFRLHRRPSPAVPPARRPVQGQGAG